MLADFQVALHPPRPDHTGALGMTKYKEDRLFSARRQSVLASPRALRQ